jgi:hypothetical protein
VKEEHHRDTETTEKCGIAIENLMFDKLSMKELVG